MFGNGLVLNFELGVPGFHTRGPKDLKNDTGSVNFFKHFKGTPPSPYPPKRDMSDPKRQFQEKHTFKRTF
jgi:hypothetical protein